MKIIARWPPIVAGPDTFEVELNMQPVQLLLDIVSLQLLAASLIDALDLRAFLGIWDINDVGLSLDHIRRVQI